ncbi:MAG: hypothetical protein KAX20_06525 [Candidatus Omnitrophica bacterium]|nr:hypothetical protein [Candidatus Omnitrophota bacterium]
MEKKKKAELIFIGVLVAVTLISILVARQSRLSYRKLERNVEERIAKLSFPYLEEVKDYLKEAAISAKESNFGDANKALKKASKNIEKVLSAARRPTKRRIQQVAEIIKKIEKEVAAGNREIGPRVDSATRIIDEIVQPKKIKP